MNQPDDHMDELFRKAGELYPLRTDGQNWEQVLAGLQPKPEGGAILPASKRGYSGARRLWWLTLLLLLPLGWLTWKFAGTAFHQQSATVVAKAQPAGGTASGGAATAAASGATAATTLGAASGATAASTPGAASGVTAASTPGATSASNPGAASGATSASNPGAASGKSASSVPGLVPGAASSATAGSTHGDIASSSSAAAGSHRSAKSSNNGAPGSTSPEASRFRTNDPSIIVPAEAALATTSNSKSPDVQPSNPFEWTAGDLANTNAQKSAADLALAAPNANDHPKGPNALKVTTPKRIGPKRGFYAGVLGGPDISLVKFQQVEHPGYSLGLLVGYRFNRTLSVEASALWDRKNYYTTGEYFNKTNAGFPATDQINSMSGNCNMFEIPLSVRWDFLPLKKGGFYATAGVSSYIMKQESYSYNASYNGASWDGQKSYQNSGNDFLSIMHLSAGYTVPWGRVGDLRIEPYWKIPLSGVGIGNLPITSMGLYLGLTHSFR